MSEKEYMNYLMSDLTNLAAKYFGRLPPHLISHQMIKFAYGGIFCTAESEEIALKRFAEAMDAAAKHYKMFQTFMDEKDGE